MTITHRSFRLSTASVLALATNSAKPTRKTPRHLEAQEQRLFVKRWRTDPRTRSLPACAVPNGGKRGAREAALMKAEGVSAGVPDWLCFAHGQDADYPEHKNFGLALEFKSPTNRGRVSPEQKWWLAELRYNNWRVHTVTSAEQAWAIVCHYLYIKP